MKSLRIQVCLTLLLVLAGCPAMSAEMKVAPEGTTSVELVHGSKTVRVDIETKLLPLRKPQPLPDLLNMECPSFENRCPSITHMTLSIDGNFLLVPDSAFSGLDDPGKVELTAKDDGYLLTIHGADGALGYYAWIEFDDERVLRRSLASGMSAHEISEETIYHETTPLD